MLITNFASGELSPMLNGRTDLQSYYQGAGKLLNFDVIPTGGIARRVGTERIKALHGACRLIPMILDSTTSFIFEVIPNINASGCLMYVWKNGEKMTDETGAQIAIAGPWSSLDEIREIQYAQNYNIMVFVQQDAAPFMVTYNLSGTFTSASMTFDFTPDVELDDDYSQCYTWSESALPAYNTFDGTAYQWLIFQGKLYYWSGESDLTSTTTNTTVYWEKDTSATDYDQDESLFSTVNYYPGAVAFFGNRLYFAGTRANQQKVWASAAPDVTDTNGENYNEFATYKKYVTVNRVVKDEDIHYFTASVSSGAYTLTGLTQDLSEIAENITSYYITGDCFASGTKCVSYDATGNTLTVSAAATSALTSQTFSVQLWVTANSASSADYEYKIVNQNLTTDDCGFFFELASDQNDAIKWMATSKYLVIGTESANYVVPASVTANSISASMDGRYGTDRLQATTVQTATLFFSQGKKSIREYYYSADSEAFVSNDLALSDKDILSSEAVDFDFMANPYSRILITREDGTMAVLLYEKAVGVQAWSNIETGDGKIQSVAVTRGDSGSDFVYLSVLHGETYYLEKIDMEKEVYLDSWSIYTTDITGYEDTAVIYNAAQDRYVTKAEFTDDFMAEGDDVYIGYGYKSLIKSMPIVANDGSDKKRITALAVRFYNSYKPELEVTGKSNEVFTSFTEPYSGVKKITYPGDSDRDVTFTLSIDTPQPCTILAVNAETA